MEDEFKAQLKADRCKGTLRKQTRRKAGVPAKRIDLGERLPAEKVALKDGYRIENVRGYLAGNYLLDYADWSSNRRFCSAFLDIRTWPPKQSTDIELVIHGMALSKNGVYAAMVGSNVTNEEGYLSDWKDKILIGSDLSDIEQWELVYEKEDLEWSAMVWFEDELFAANKEQVFHIKDVKHFADSMHTVLEYEPADIHSWPEFFIVGDKLFLCMNQFIYQWDKNAGFKQIYELEEYSSASGDFVPMGENRVAFILSTENPISGKKEKALAVLDITTLEVKKYPCKPAWLRRWKENCVCAVSVMANNTKQPIIECFDFNTNEKRRLMYGALGTDGVSDIIETEAGTVLLGSGNHIYLTTQLWDFMKLEKKCLDEAKATLGCKGA